MSSGMDDIEMMDAYFEGKMSDEERAAFEAKLLIDDNFREEFEIYKKVRTGIYQAGEDELREKLNAADLSMESIGSSFNPKYFIPLYKKILVAASIAVLLTTTYFLFIKENINYKRFEEKEPGLPVLMNSNGKSSLDKAMTLYKTGDYSASKEIIETLLISNSSNDTLIYFSGVLNYELEEYSEAIESFKAVAGSKSVFSEKAEYRLALSFLRISQKNNAKELLEEITQEPAHLYKKQAEELLKQL
jgi:tetratricopeptide (TPR) repeat protein